MAQYDNDDQFEDDLDSEEVAPKPRRRRVDKSTGTNWGKIFLILGGVGFVSLLLCCGGFYYFASRAFEMTQDPVKIAAMQREIAEIDIPPDVQPAMGMNINFGVMKMKMVMYNPNMGTSLALMQMQLAGQTKEQMQDAFRQQAGQHQQNNDFRQESSETKTVKVDGQDVDFLFAKGSLNPASGAPIPVRMITGMFPAKDGMGFIQYTVNEKKYDEAAVLKMLESIHK